MIRGSIDSLQPQYFWCCGVIPFATRCEQLASASSDPDATLSLLLRDSIALLVETSKAQAAVEPEEMWTAGRLVTLLRAPRSQEASSWITLSAKSETTGDHVLFVLGFFGPDMWADETLRKCGPNVVAPLLWPQSELPGSQGFVRDSVDRPVYFDC